MITGWTIKTVERDHPAYGYEKFEFIHENYDGAPDGNNHLAGFGDSLADCWGQIKDIEDE